MQGGLQPSKARGSRYIYNRLLKLPPVYGDPRRNRSGDFMIRVVFKPLRMGWYINYSNNTY